MAIVAYSGHPDGRIFSRHVFGRWDQARIAVWNDGALFDLHDTEKETTYWDHAWAETTPPHAAPVQQELFT
jgi:hypothetical protein